MWVGVGEVWSRLQRDGVGVGVPASLARFYTTEVRAECVVYISRIVQVGLPL